MSSYNLKDDNSANKVVSPYANSHAIDTLSHDSDSTDEGVQGQGNCPLSL